MSDRELVKEIITTETEKYTDEGKVKERVKETREKIYSYDKVENYDKVDKIIDKSEPKKEEEKKEDLVKQAAQAIENKKPQAQQPATTPQPTVPQPPVSPAFQPTPVAPYMPQQYNVLARNPVVEKPTFPWENKQS